jgi:hypothetical protein
MARELLYPERQRCRACRRHFDFIVILRLYCSRSCAGLPEQPANTEDLPRKCRVRENGVWRPKRVYFSPDEAERGMRANRNASFYLCDPPDGCGMYHTSKRTTPYEPAAGAA